MVRRLKSQDNFSRRIRTEKKYYDSFEKKLYLSIPETEKIRLMCANGHNIPLDFHEKIPPLRYEDHGNGQSSVPISKTFFCPTCNEKTDLELPVHKQEKKFYCFGDEAFRESGKMSEVYTVTYSLVCVSSEYFLELEEELLKFKHQFFPNIDPWNWKIHLKEIISGDKRKKHMAFNDKDKSFVDDFIENLFEFIKELVASKKITIINSTVISRFPPNINKNKYKDNLKEFCYSNLAFFNIHIFTNNKAQPVMIFDAEKPVKDREVIQGWAKDIFYSMQFTLTYPFLTKGIHIPDPKFVTPASRPFLEIADVICYTVGRYIEKKILNETELIFNPNKFGDISYIIPRKSGRIEVMSKNEFPWDEINS